MSASKRAFAALGALIAALVAMAAFSSAAFASSNQPTPGQVGGPICAGCTITFTASGFTPGENAIGIEVSITVSGAGQARAASSAASYSLGSLTANSAGVISGPATLSSNITGPATLSYTGSKSGHVASIRINITAGTEPTSTTAPGGTGPGTTGNGGGLASTGVAVIGIGSLGIVLLAGGSLMLFAGKRRSKYSA